MRRKMLVGDFRQRQEGRDRSFTILFSHLGIGLVIKEPTQEQVYAISLLLQVKKNGRMRDKTPVHSPSLNPGNDDSVFAL